jgi:hypothetical protein
MLGRASCGGSALADVPVAGYGAQWAVDRLSAFGKSESRVVCSCSYSLSFRSNKMAPTRTTFALRRRGFTRPLAASLRDPHSLCFSSRWNVASAREFPMAATSMILPAEYRIPMPAGGQSIVPVHVTRGGNNRGPACPIVGSGTTREADSTNLSLTLRRLPLRLR